MVFIAGNHVQDSCLPVGCSSHWLTQSIFSFLFFLVPHVLYSAVVKHQNERCWVPHSSMACLTVDRYWYDALQAKAKSRSSFLDEGRLLGNRQLPLSQTSFPPSTIFKRKKKSNYSTLICSSQNTFRLIRCNRSDLSGSFSRWTCGFQNNGKEGVSLPSAEVFLGVWAQIPEELRSKRANYLQKMHAFRFRWCDCWNGILSVSV